MIKVEIIKVHAGQILPCGRVTGNKEFTIGGLICMFLGCDMPIQLMLSSDYDDNDRLEDRFIMYRFTSRTTKYVTFYALTNRLTRFSTCNLPVAAASLC